ncbi:MAG: hypothetical protein GWP62_03280 [Gammaproteobacteria bacterium]|jgi:hypothetical protein|nr:hypothetical protein [Gammaproteobacteria bacterium]
MLKPIYIILMVLAPAISFAEEPEEATEDAVEAVQEETENGDGIKNPRSMSGMSILGNEETPKSLVIIPWKSSEMGDALTFSDTLKDRARPVDKDVFLRELRFYEIRTEQ